MVGETKHNLKKFHENIEFVEQSMKIDGYTNHTLLNKI